MHMLHRMALEHLDRWLEKPNRKPLVIRGARQVGKSTLVRNFAERHRLKLFEVNLERHPSLADTFESLDPKRILTEISYLVGGGPIRSGEALVFLDEIQAVPRALQSLRYFHEDMPELAVISAGSLLEFTLASHSFPMPVGRVEYFHLGPMNWEEFLQAKYGLDLLELLRNYQWRDAFPRAAHERLLRLLREFLLVGGMPEAVQHYSRHDEIEGVIEIQNSIVQTYRDDFSKYARGTELVRLHRILDYMGGHSGEKVKFSNIDRETQARELRKALDLLLRAGVLFAAIHSHGNGIPLLAEQDPKVFKLYHIDLGFYNRTVGLRNIRERDLISQSWINEGKLAEQFIAQHLFFEGAPQAAPKLHYWLREGRTGNAEVDFLVEFAEQVLPIEVKAGGAGSMKSLVQFIHQKSGSIAVRFDLNPPASMPLQTTVDGHDVSFNLISLPLYLVGQMRRLCNG
jgi:uncharacterized protein